MVYVEALVGVVAFLLGSVSLVGAVVGLLALVGAVRLDPCERCGHLRASYGVNRDDGCVFCRHDHLPHLLALLRHHRSGGAGGPHAHAG